MVYNLTIGSPAANCQGGNTTITSMVGGTLTIQDMWSVGGTANLNLGIFQVGVNASGSQTNSISWSQTISIDVQPGQKVCWVWSTTFTILMPLCKGVVVASVNYKRSSGSITVEGKYTSR